MLVDNKFIYVSLPRCASTSFYISCLRNNIKVEHSDEVMFNKWNSDINLDLDNETLADLLVHSHEKIVDLKTKFGSGYEVVSIRRNRYERFISLWKHIIDLADSRFPNADVDKLKKMNVSQILFYKREDLVSDNTKEYILNSFFDDNDLTDYKDSYMMTMIYILINPTSFWHNNDTNIIWFDFDKMNEFEEWVSNKLEIDFVLEKSNGSQHFECELKLNDEFIERYNSIYDYYDLPKQTKTLL
jgi:hypothetical protein